MEDVNWVKIDMMTKIIPILLISDFKPLSKLGFFTSGSLDKSLVLVLEDVESLTSLEPSCVEHFEPTRNISMTKAE